MGDQGPQGDPGLDGATGPTGPTGPPGTSAVIPFAFSRSIQLAHGEQGELEVKCPPGQVAVAGGFDTLGAQLSVQRSRPTTNLGGWTIHARNDIETGGGSIEVHVICVPSSRTL